MYLSRGEMINPGAATPQQRHGANRQTLDKEKTLACRHRTEMHTEERSSGTAPVVWEESTSCSFGAGVKIEPPR